MKRILLLSYHSLPLNVIASYRTEAYLKYFRSFDLFPVLVTMDFENKGTEVILEEEEDYNIYRLRKPEVKQMDAGKVGLFFNWLQGKLDFKESDFEAYEVFKTFLFSHLRDHSYDALLTIFSPFHHIKLASELYKSFKVPYVIDFRDLHDNRILSDQPIPFTSRLKNRITEYHLKKWTKNALFLTAVSRPHVEYLISLTRRKAFEVMNGFEKEIANTRSKGSLDKFMISSVGNLQNCQKPELFYDGLGLFLENVSDKNKVQVNFIGITDNYRKGAREEISANISGDVLNLSDRVPKEEANKIIGESSLIIFPTLVGFKGNYTGKFFEYIGSKKPLLLFPEDEEFSRFKELPSIKFANTPAEIAKYLETTFTNWEEGNPLDFSSMDVEPYSRKAQAENMAKLLKENLQN